MTRVDESFVRDELLGMASYGYGALELDGSAPVL